MSTITMFIVTTVFSMTMVVNLMGCLWWWIAVVEGIPNSWAALEGASLAGPALWAACTSFATTELASKCIKFPPLLSHRQA